MDNKIILFTDRAELWNILTLLERGQVITALMNKYDPETAREEMSVPAHLLYVMCQDDAKNYKTFNGD